MEQISLQKRCKINTNIDADTFVGVLYDNGEISISFPLGYHLSSDDIGLRKDILLLIKIISRNSDQTKSKIQINARNFSDEVSFPINAYLYLIRDYMEHGYYKETESQYIKAKRGKISWAKTIKTQKPFIQDGDAFYLDYMIKKNQINMNELITLIHEYCVYESYQKIGWLFTDFIPPKPHINFQRKLFTSVLKEKLNHTFNDKNKRLFQNMLAMVMWLGDSNSTTKYTFGTYRFEYIWEKMIDRVYGIKNKSKYFPHTIWNINNEDYDNASLEPDTIMLWDDKIFVLDAKYYQYGRTMRPHDLPESPSINKQITYAEYIAFNKFDSTVIYNAFLLPFDSVDENKPILYFGVARSDWKLNKETYEYVYGILLDVKYLMERSSEYNVEEIEEMANEIEKAAMTVCLT